MAEVLVVGANLLFLSKIQEAARAHGLTANPAPVDDAVSRAPECRLIIVDLERVPVDQASRLIAAGATRVVGFASHGRTELLEAARAAGIEPMSKGQLTTHLSSLFT